MHEPKVVYPHDGTLFGNEKGCGADTRHNTDLRNVTPSERSQRAKATCGAIRLTCNVFLKQGKSMQMADWWLPGGQGGAEMEPPQMGKWDLWGCKCSNIRSWS